MQRFISVFFMLTLMFILAPVSPVSADIAPPEEADGITLQPGSDSTLVQMVRERVDLNIYVLNSKNGVEECVTFQTGSTIAEVDALFVMQNQGNQTETMSVRFPLQDMDKEYYAACDILCDFQVQVNGETVPVDIIHPDSLESNVPFISWGSFQASFPPGQNVEVRVKYLLNAQHQRKQSAGQEFYYILSTGAGWFGKIGLVEIRLRLPYPANAETIYQMPKGSSFEGRELSLTFNDFEPTSADNLHFGLIHPHIWESVLASRAVADLQPGNAQAWIELGRLYAGLTFGYHEYDFPQYENLANQAFSKAIELEPSAIAYLEYVDFLLQGYELTYDTSPIHELQVKEVFTQLEESIDLDPEAVNGNGNTAAMLWERCCKISPDYCLEFNNLRGSRPMIEEAVTPPPNESPGIETTKTNPICGSLLIVWLPVLVILNQARRKHIG